MKLVCGGKRRPRRVVDVANWLLGFDVKNLFLTLSWTSRTLASSPIIELSQIKKKMKEVLLCCNHASTFFFWWVINLFLKWLREKMVLDNYFPKESLQFSPFLTIRLRSILVNIPNKILQAFEMSLLFYIWVPSLIFSLSPQNSRREANEEWIES